MINYTSAPLSQPVFGPYRNVSSPPLIEDILHWVFHIPDVQTDGNERRNGACVYCLTPTIVNWVKCCCSMGHDCRPCCLTLLWPLCMTWNWWKADTTKQQPEKQMISCKHSRLTFQNCAHNEQSLTHKIDYPKRCLIRGEEAYAAIDKSNSGTCQALQISVWLSVKTVSCSGSQYIRKVLVQ